MNALTKTANRLPPPTRDEPIPSLAEAPGRALLKSGVLRLAEAGHLTTENQSDLRDFLGGVRKSLTPATTMEVAIVLEGLALHYPVLRRTDGENDVVIRQWADDLAEYPLDLLEEAARLWRNSPAERFPTPGQFKALVQPILSHRQTLERFAAKVLGLCP